MRGDVQKSARQTEASRSSSCGRRGVVRWLVTADGKGLLVGGGFAVLWVGERVQRALHTSAVEYAGAGRRLHRSPNP